MGDDGVVGMQKREKKNSWLKPDQAGDHLPASPISTSSYLFFFASAVESHRENGERGRPSDFGACLSFSRRT